MRVTWLSESSPLPWTLPEHRACDRYTWVHRVFIGVAPVTDWVRLVRVALGGSEVPDEGEELRLGSSQYGYTAYFDTDVEGLPDVESYTTARFVEGVSELRGRCGPPSKMSQGFCQRVESNKARNLQGLRSSCSFARTDLLLELQGALDFLEVRASFVRPQFVVRSSRVERQALDNNEKPNAEFLDSFYSKELNGLIEVASGKKGGLGTALESYLGRSGKTDARHDVLQDSDALTNCLKVAGLTRGRWPSPPAHSLSLGQQAAVGRARLDLRRGAGLVAVNGPPGTGKTTLLRDLIAEAVVERALKLSELGANPERLFRAKVTVGGEPFFPLALPFASESGVVVTSSNNAAVANISKELPLRAAIDTKCFGEATYLQAVAAGLAVDEEVWGLLAFSLGNKANREQVANGLFDGRGKRLTLQSYLASGGLENSQGARRQTWERARSRFMDLNERVRETLSRCRELELCDAQCSELRRRLGCVEKDGHRSHQARQLLREEQARQEKDWLHREGQMRDEAQLLDVSCEKAKARLALAQATLKAKVGEERPGWWSRTLHGMGLRRKNVSQWVELKRSLYEEVSQATECAHATFLNRNQHREQLNSARDQQALESDAASSKLVGLNEQVALLEEEAGEARRALKKSRIRLRSLQVGVGKTPGDLLNSQPVTASAHKQAAWVTPQFEKLRSELFLAALDLHEALLLRCRRQTAANAKALSLWLSSGMSEYPRAKETVALWNFLFLCVPVVSTTLASFRKQFRYMNSQSIGWLLVDEAGQATPQSLAGALWRARRAVVVGDPRQIKPVVTVSQEIVTRLQERHKVGSEWSPLRWSAQELADRGMRYGAFIDTSGGDPVWTGLPLRAHRRCDEPMFAVANTIAYAEQMVQAGSPRKSLVGALDTSFWLNVRASRSEGQVVPEELQCFGQLLHEMSKSWPKQSNGKLASAFVITPFRRVAAAVSAELTRVRQALGADLPMTRGDIGTLHTFQGREADIVILVLGSAPGAEGAGSRKWASAEPNLLNVALTRAKQVVCVIGDRQSWSKCPGFDTLAARLPHRAPFAPTPTPVPSRPLNRFPLGSHGSARPFRS